MIFVNRGKEEWQELLVNESTSPSFAGILDGTCMGKLWVDQLEHPSLALVYSYCVGGYHLFGKCISQEEYDALIHFLKTELFVEDEKNGIEDFEFASNEEAARLLETFKDKGIEKGEELTYVKNKESALVESSKSTEDYVFYQVDEALLAEIKSGAYSHSEALLEGMLHSWHSEQDFLEKGMAYIAIEKGKREMAAYILGSARYKDKMAIDIATVDIHRRKGLAKHLVYLFVKECKKKGIIPWWNCVIENQGSIKLAEGAGFSYMGKHDFYWFRH